MGTGGCFDGRKTAGSSSLAFRVGVKKLQSPACFVNLVVSDKHRDIFTFNFVTYVMRGERVAQSAVQTVQSVGQPGVEIPVGGDVIKSKQV